MFMYRPLVHPWGVSYILILAADIGAESWSYTPYVQFFGSPVLVPLQLHNNKLSCQAVHQFAHQNPIYTRWKPSVTEVQCSLGLEFTQWLRWWNACWASVTTSQTWNNKNTSTSGDSKWIQNKVRIYRLISSFFFSPLHQLTVNRTHDDPCSASLGYFHTEGPETFEALQHTP